jgi:hypothetical protein
VDELSRYREQLKLTDAQLEAFTLKLEKAFRRGLTTIISKLRKGDEQAIETAKAIASVPGALAEAGLSEILEQLDPIYIAQISAITAKLDRAKISPEFGDIDHQVIETMIDFESSQVGAEVASRIQDFSSNILQTAFTGEPTDFVAALDDAGNRLQTNVYNDQRTAVLSFERTITVRKALQSGSTLFLYIGPDDKVTRDFCLCILEGRSSSTFGIQGKSPPIFTLEEIKAMDNGQGLEVLTACGGYNCRHSWNPVSEDRAAELGYKP